jgi:hypothetical protein
MTSRLATTSQAVHERARLDMQVAPSRRQAKVGMSRRSPDAVVDVGLKGAETFRNGAVQILG